MLVLFILLVGIAFKHDAFESLLFAVALGVGLTPEFLPMISSVTLTQGALRMARDQVIVKHLPAIQNFGSIDILCSDKTGTLTTGVMQFDRAVDPIGAASPRPLTLAYINSRFETGIRSPLDAAILQQPPLTSRATRRSTKSRSISSGAACRWWSRRPDGGWPSAAHHQGRAGADPRTVHGVRSRRSGRAARRGQQAQRARRSTNA